MRRNRDVYHHHSLNKEAEVQGATCVLISHFHVICLFFILVLHGPGGPAVWGISLCCKSPSLMLMSTLWRAALSCCTEALDCSICLGDCTPSRTLPKPSPTPPLCPQPALHPPCTCRHTLSCVGEIPQDWLLLWLLIRQLLLTCFHKGARASKLSGWYGEPGAENFTSEVQPFVVNPSYQQFLG